MTGEIWIPEAERLTPRGTPGTMSGVGGPRATLHCTVSLPGSFSAMHGVLIAKKAEPHLLYDPKTDRLGQYFPLDRSARALKGAPEVSPSHNKAGTRNIQVEVCAMPNDWTEGWTPGPNFRAMMRAIRSHGIADRFVDRLPRNSGDRGAVAQSRAMVTSNKGGGLWWGHCHYPSPEVHWDPGPINLGRFFGVADSIAEEDDMPYSEAQLRQIAREAVAWGYENYRHPKDAVGRSMYGLLLQAATGQEPDYNALAGAVLAQLPSNSGIDQATLSGAIVEALKKMAAETEVAK